MYFTNGNYIMGGNFKIKKAAPMDDRGTVAKKIDLQNPNLFDGFTYNGMIVSVVDDTVNNGIYRLEDKTTKTWIKEGADSTVELTALIDKVEGVGVEANKVLTSKGDGTSEWLAPTGGSGGDIDLTDYYTKSETYSKVEVDTKIADIPETDLSGYYDKTETYNKSEVDNIIDNIPATDLSNYYNKTQTETLLSNKIDKGVGVVGATKTKITYNNDGLITGGADLEEADLPNISQAKITHLVSDLSNKQSRLISGTNIKTINGQSILGNGNIFITAESASPLLQPIITSPANGTVDYIGSITSTYSTSESFVGVQDWVRWEASTNTSFTNIVDSYEGNINLTSWSPSIGLDQTEIFVRTKQGSDGHRSKYSEVISFTTPNIFVEAPILTVVGSPDNVTLTPLLTGNTFKVYNGVDTHISSDWQVVKVSDSSVIWESLNDTQNKLSITTSTLPKNTDLIFRVRYKGAVYGSSAWTEVTARTLNIYVENPTITVEGTPNDVPKNPTISGSAFSVMNGTDTHESTDYQAVKVSDGVVVWESLANTVNKTSIKTGDLVESTAYIFKMRYKGATYGYSQWVQVTGTTKDVFTIPIGIQGKKGFGVAPTDKPFAVLGLVEMTGTNDPASDNYGNYIHTNGSIVCWCPKAYYRVGSSESPRFATYGANALDIVGAETFSTTAEANTAGYALHRAFINAGAEQSGFFIDKYMNSKDGNSSSKSVFGGVPISLVTTADYTVSNGMTGCTGILADAVVLSRARGTRWNTATAFMYGYLAMVSVAQAQAATSTDDVAWYDPKGVKNFPKGCNNNALSDANDTSVVYASAGDSGNANKPKTGATVGFAKTTHNGSANGVADLNGGMWEVTIGITNFGTSATAAAAITTDQIYVLKQSVDVATLTGGWNTANDVWGDATNLATKYDLVTSPHPLGSSTGVVYWGNGSNAVLQNDLSGVNRDVCGFVPKNSTATSATGVNLFGNDYLYKYNIQNMVPLTCGSWLNSATAGVFSRYFYVRRSGGVYNASFRASAYVAL